MTRTSNPSNPTAEARLSKAAAKRGLECKDGRVVVAVGVEVATDGSWFVVTVDGKCHRQLGQATAALKSAEAIERHRAVREESE